MLNIQMLRFYFHFPYLRNLKILFKVIIIESPSLLSVYLLPTSPYFFWPPFSCREPGTSTTTHPNPFSAFLSRPQTFAFGPRSPEWRGAWKFAAAHLSISCGQPAEVSTSVSGTVLVVPAAPAPAFRELFAKFGACQTAKCFPDQRKSVGGM